MFMGVLSTHPLQRLLVIPTAATSELLHDPGWLIFCTGVAWHVTPVQIVALPGSGNTSDVSAAQIYVTSASVVTQPIVGTAEPSPRIKYIKSSVSCTAPSVSHTPVRIENMMDVITFVLIILKSPRLLHFHFLLFHARLFRIVQKHLRQGQTQNV